jgi:HSP20 family protein
LALLTLECQFSKIKLEASYASQDLFNNNERRTIMSNLTRWDPFSELNALQRQFFGDDWLSPLKGVNIPTTDVYTKDNQLTVEAHLPNFEQKDINIQLEDNALVISAERHEKEEDKDKKFVVRESSSSFYRRIALPKRADREKIEAQLNDGVLKVAVPLTPLPEPKKIAIANKATKK